MEEKNKSIEYIIDDNYREDYANFANIATSPYDITIKFGKVIDSTNENIKIKLSEGIILSPKIAKELVELLNKNIEFYEKNFGEINKR
ncbi:DUF3467 domain-containing protein [Marinitoga sp. 1155]|uniref:DUF3467 domain-containing protein n=1 Tax=Marinitoga sp. 1155 TaxID=1428448 RepID=UPI000641517E|nr:DUF3467 domain-containing protein [Marinitoga sp. 1155]AMS34001.1 hypothetical protein UF09_59 [Marinitoga camini virus 2]KLO24736.1 hypothetical protein X274_02190 [Marinitoga sp. 1155]